MVDAEQRIEVIGEIDQRLELLAELILLLANEYAEIVAIVSIEVQEGVVGKFAVAGDGFEAQRIVDGQIYGGCYSFGG